jgi:glycosyltransferase involved in cell wall biosynthesis
MRSVLHVGPCRSPGGMATVMQTLADRPPEGWKAELLSSHAEGSLWAKWRAYQRARGELRRRCAGQQAPDVVHVHVASDWSWRRKSRMIREAQHHNVPVVVHLHSGQFDAWLARAGASRAGRVKQTLAHPGVQTVVLSSAWKERLEPLIGPARVVGNPLPSPNPLRSASRDEQHLLMLGRKDPTKGHGFAVDVAMALRKEFPNLRLTMTGEHRSEHDWVDARGWVSDEEKNDLLARASVLLVPSTFEGQPMVALEALSAGLPVCVSDRVVGLPETVHHAKLGDVEDWVATVRSLLTDKHDAEELVASVDHHTLDSVQETWKSIYESF